MTRKLGRENAGGGREWYVKDYQGSLVMTIVNDAVGNVIAYEPYGSQKLLQANGDMPSEQYTGKEYVGRLGLYYFGARFFDPTFAMWLTPDPAGQYLNPYSYGGDPINAVDYDGRWGWKALGLGALDLLSGGAISSTVGAIGSSAIGTAALGVGSGTVSGAISLGYEVYSNEGFDGVDWKKVGNSFESGILAGIPGAPEWMTYASFASRYVKSGFDWHIATDFFTGGYLMDYTGNGMGMLNASIGGNMDWYEGNVVYSGAIFGEPAKYFNGGDYGFDHFGHAVYVSDRYRKDMIAHELTHVRQFERQGFRFGYLFSYLRFGPISSKMDGYDENPYEMEAYYFQFLYNQKCVDMYGNIKEGVKEDHDAWSKKFYGYTDKYGVEHSGYRNNSGVQDHYGDSWTWEEDWSFYEAP